MVLFININVGQNVEVLHKGRILAGTVKFKGSLANVRGDWVGIDLQEPLGKHCGIFKGRQYFTCHEKHGIFVHPSCVRFSITRRCLFNSYRTVSPTSIVDETLFQKRKSHIRSKTVPTSISDSYLVTASDGFDDLKRSWDGRIESNTWNSALSYSDTTNTGSLSPSRTFNLLHSVSGTRKAATMRPKTAARSLSYTSVPIHAEYDEEVMEFITTPTIPKSHMPMDVLARQDKRGWDRLHKPREWTI
ncbi:uncharacterized protein [Antedon mediterranea]|uniref:uncharacterized protein n=1 Tax=Antedon mediterranea TaxID=105859 RepID=UPI003AF6FCEA